jgi:protein arginine kinase activator
MKMCEECGLHQANIHLTQIAGNESQSFHLCETCARKRGITIAIDEEAINAGEAQLSPAPIEPDRECPSCLTKLSEFRDTGRLGCPDCYHAFENEIEELLLQFNGSAEHKGKSYRGETVDKKDKTDLSLLRSELDSAIRNEEFERAAKLRDAIHHQRGMEAR